MRSPLRVLIVDDSATDAKLVVQELRRGGRLVEFERVETLEAMRAAFEPGGWDVVVSDWSMPRFNVAAALGVLRERSLDLPFIIVSGTIGEEVAVEAMRTGAHDYVLKDKLARLGPAVERELRESAERMFGYSHDEVIGKALADVIIPVGQRAVHRAGLQRYLATGEGSLIGKRTEVSALRKDGTEFAVEVAIARIGASTPGSFLGFIRDVSERQRAEGARRESDARYRRNIETTTQGVWLIDTEGRTTFANERMAALLGATSGKLRRWRRWAGSRAALPTTSTTCCPSF